MRKFPALPIFIIPLTFSLVFSLDRPEITTQYSDEELLSLSKEAIIQQHIYLYTDYVIEGEDLPLERLVEGDLQHILKRKRELEKSSSFDNNSVDISEGIELNREHIRPVHRNVNRSISDTLEYFPSGGSWNSYFVQMSGDAMMIMHKIQASGTLKGVNVPVYRWGTGDQELTISIHRVSLPLTSDGSAYSTDIVNSNGWIGGYDMDASTGYMSIEGTTYTPGGTQGICNSGYSVPDNVHDPLGTEDGLGPLGTPTMGLAWPDGSTAATIDPSTQDDYVGLFQSSGGNIDHWIDLEDFGSDVSVSEDEWIGILVHFTGDGVDDADDEDSNGDGFADDYVGFWAESNYDFGDGPFVFTKFYDSCGGTSGNGGWHIRSWLIDYQLAIEYDNNPPPIHVSGSVYGNWSADTVFVDGYTTVDNHRSLTIQEGVTVFMTGHHDFDIYGDLHVNGTETDSVKFTSYADPSAPSDSWNGLRFWDHDGSRTQTSNINYAIIENAGNGIYYHGVGIQDTTPPHHTISNSMIRMNTRDGIGSENKFEQLKIDNCTITRNGWWNYGVGVWIGWDAENVSLINSTITHNGYENEGDYGVGVRIYHQAKNILVDNNLIQYNQPQYFSSDQGDGRGIGIEWTNADALITNNTITYNGTASFGYDEWQNWGVRLRYSDGNHFPVFQNNVIHSNGDIEVRFTDSWEDWDQNDYEVDFRNNDWGSTINNEMSNANNPANISVIHDQFDENHYPFVNYACWEGADCGYSGDLSFTNATGSAYNLTYPAGAETLFVHVYDEGEIGDGNEDTVTVYITSDTDSDNEEVVCVGTGNDYLGYIPIDLQSTRVMTDEQEEELREQFIANVSNENPDWSATRVASYAGHLFINEYQRLYEMGVRVEHVNSSRNDGYLQVRQGDMIETTYYDDSGDWGIPDTSNAEIIFGGYEGRLKGTWTAANSPYVITGYSYVAPNDTLIIEAGTEVKFLENTQMKVDGNIWAFGTQTDSIKFIPFGEVDPYGRSWQGLNIDYNYYEFDGHQRALFDYCVFKDAQDVYIYLENHEDNNSDSVVVRFNNCLVTENDGSGFNINFNSRENQHTTGYSEIKILNSTIVKNNQQGIYLGHGWGGPLLINNCIIHHNGYYYDYSDHYWGIWLESSGDNVVINDCDIRYNQSQLYGNDDVGQGRGNGIMMRYSNAIITNNVIRDNGDPDFSESWRNSGIWMEGMHGGENPVINYNEIYDNGPYEVWVDWGDPGHKLNLRYNNWGTEATSEMESGTNPQNISIFTDWHDDNNRPYINYSCYEGNTSSCGNDGVVYFAHKNGDHVHDQTYRLWDIENNSDVDSIYIHLHDSDLENAGVVSVTLTSETDTTGETIILTETDSAGWFFGGIPFDLQSSRAMTLEEEAAFMEQFSQEFTDQFPDQDEEAIERMAQNEIALIRKERNLNGERVYISLNPNARDDGSLQVRTGDMLYATYSDASDDWGSESDIVEYVVFGGLDGGLEGRLTVANSPYVITGGVHVSNRLRIDPGVTIKFFTWTNIDVYDNSSLIAIGTEEDSITFERHELYRTPGEQVWYGIQDYNWCCNENDRDTLILKYVNLHDASAGVMIRDWESNDGAVDHVEISNSRFSRNGNAIEIQKEDNGHSNILIKDSDISWNDRGLYIQDGRHRSDEIVIDNCDITHNGSWDEWSDQNFGIDINNESKVTIKDSRIMYNQPRYFSDDEGNGRGIGIFIHHSRPTIIGNTIAENGAMNFNNDNWHNVGIWFEGIYEDYDDITINHNNIYNNGPFDAYFHYGCCEDDSVDMSQNYWGEFTTNEIESGENPQNLTRIYDRYDSNNEYRYIDYKNWRTEPVYQDFMVRIGQPDAIPNDTMAVDVFVATPYDTNFISAELTFGGYSGLMDFLSIDTSNTLAGDNGWMVLANETSSEGLELIITAAAGADPISGAGVFFRLNFVVPDTALGLIPITLEDATFNSGGLDVDYENGGIEVLALVIGDVDWNGMIQAVDGGWILKHIVGMTTLNHRSLAVADATGDMSLSALDATTILDYVVGIVDSLPYDGNGYANAYADLQYENAYVEAGQEIDVPLTVSNPHNIHSVEGRLSLESDLVRFSGLTWPESLNGHLKQLSVEDNTIRFAAAGQEIEDQTDLSIILHLTVSAEFADTSNIPLLVDYFRWNEELPVENQLIQIMHFSLKTGLEGLIPDVFALHQNYPNPFNPVTNIRYDIPENAHVRMVIYDILGRHVRTLVNRDHDPGFYDVLWDGRNDLGEQISSGVYFYQIKAGNFNKNAKMIVVK